MYKVKIAKTISVSFILISAINLLIVSLMAIKNPQDVMNLVNIKLTNTDAFSSIRGVYGGVGLTIFISLIYLLFNNIRLALSFLSILWGSYALSRLITIYTEGPLGTFGSQWIWIEAILGLCSLFLLILEYRLQINNK